MKVKVGDRTIDIHPKSPMRKALEAVRVTEIEWRSGVISAQEAMLSISGALRQLDIAPPESRESGSRLETR